MRCNLRLKRTRMGRPMDATNVPPTANNNSRGASEAAQGRDVAAGEGASTRIRQAIAAPADERGGGKLRRGRGGGGALEAARADGGELASGAIPTLVARGGRGELDSWASSAVAGGMAREGMCETGALDAAAGEAGSSNTGCCESAAGEAGG